MPRHLDKNRYTEYVLDAEHKDTFANRNDWVHAVNTVHRFEIAARKKYGLTIVSWGGLMVPPSDLYPLQTLLDARVVTLCPKGHRQPHIMVDIQYAVDNDKDDKVCRYCTALSHGTLRHRDSRVRLMMIHHERGEHMHLSTFKDMTQHYEFEYFPTGEVHRTTSSNTLKTYHSHQPRAARVVHYAQSAARAFVWASDMTADDMCNPMLAKLMDEDYKGILHRPDGRPHIGLKGYQDAILHLAEQGAEVLNIAGNPACTGPNEFSWGTISGGPLYREYIEEMESMWLDWQEGRLEKAND